MNKYTFDDLCDIIDEAVANEKNISLYLLGKDVDRILDYLECEHEIMPYEDMEDETDIKDGKVYYIDLSVDDDLHYFFGEAYYNGVLLECFEDDFEAIYIDNETHMTQLERLRGNKVFFDYADDGVEAHICKCSEGKCENCDCHGNTYDSDYYEVNGKEVDKETYDKSAKEFEDEYKEAFDKLFDAVDMLTDIKFKQLLDL